MSDNDTVDLSEENDSGDTSAKKVKLSSKTEATHAERLLYQNVLTKTILTRTNQILEATSYDGRASLQNVKVSFDDQKLTFTAEIKCPLCSKAVKLGFNQTSSPTMYNFKRHVTSGHLQLKEKEDAPNKNQPKISEAFLKVSQPHTEITKSIEISDIAEEGNEGDD